MNLKKIASILMFILASSIAWWLYDRYYVAPSLDLSQLKIIDQNSQRVDIKFSHKPTLIAFWGTWCGPCRVELPILELLYHKYHDRIDFWIISDTRSEPQIHEYLSEHPYKMPMYRSLTDLSQLDIHAVPAIYVLNADGQIVFKSINVTMKYENLDHVIDRLL